jgi:hypothetical protein
MKGAVNMRALTNEEFSKVVKIIETTAWVKEQVNRELNDGKGWDKVMFDVAVAFKVIEDTRR